MTNKEEQQLLLQLQPLLGALSAQSTEDNQELHPIKTAPLHLLQSIIDGTINKSNFYECMKWIAIHCPNNFDEILTKVNIPIPNELVDKVKQEYPEINYGIRKDCHTDIGLLTCINEKIFKYHIYFNFETTITGVCMHKNTNLLKLLIVHVNEEWYKLYKLAEAIVEYDFVNGYQMFRDYLNSDNYEHEYFAQSAGRLLSHMEDIIFVHDAIDILKHIKKNDYAPIGKHSFIKACSEKAIKCALDLYKPEYINYGSLLYMNDKMLDLLKIVIENNPTEETMQDIISDVIEKGEPECFRFIFSEKRVPITAENIKRIILRKHFNLYMILWEHWTDNPDAEREFPDIKELLYLPLSHDNVDTLKFLCGFYESTELYEWLLEHCFKTKAVNCSKWIIDKCNIPDETVMEYL